MLNLAVWFGFRGASSRIGLASLMMCWVFKNKPVSSQTARSWVYVVGCHTRQMPSFRSPPQRGTVKGISNRNNLLKFG